MDSLIRCSYYNNLFLQIPTKLNKQRENEANINLTGLNGYIYTIEGNGNKIRMSIRKLSSVFSNNKFYKEKE